MSGHHSFDKLRNRMTPERRAYNAAKTQELLAGLSLCEARGQAQADLAKRLKVKRQVIANMERRADMYVGNLRRCIENMGGTLEITARFPKGSVTIAKFSEVDAQTDERPQRESTT